VNPNVEYENKNEEVRWQIIKAMLEEFPTLKKKVRDYLRKKGTKR